MAKAIEKTVNPTKKQWDKAEALKLIESTGKSADTVQNNIQRVAVIAIGYANIHGDVTIAQRACEVFATKKGVRFNSFVKYLEYHGQLAWDKDAKNVVYHKRESAIKDEVKLLESLAGTKWYQAIKQEEVASIYDVKEAVEKLIARAKKAEKDGTEIAHAEMLQKLVGLIEVPV